MAQRLRPLCNRVEERRSRTNWLAVKPTHQAHQSEGWRLTEGSRVVEFRNAWATLIDVARSAAVVQAKEEGQTAKEKARRGRGVCNEDRKRQGLDIIRGRGGGTEEGWRCSVLVRRGQRRCESRVEGE